VTACTDCLPFFSTSCFVAELPGEQAAPAQVLLLQRDLAEAHAELAATQERLTELEALQVGKSFSFLAVWRHSH
jgi:hypothetical protein